MKLSQRISAVTPSATIAITAKARQMKTDGIDVVSFAAGEPDFDTPQFIKAACEEALAAGDTKYTPRSAAALQKTIAEKLAKENDIHVEPAQVAVTFGGKHALYAAFQVLADPGDKVLIPTPYWTSYPEMVKLASAEPLYLPATREQGFKISPQQILEAPGEAKILIVNSPSNPTGVTYTPEELSAIAEAVLEKDLIVFSDEIYEKLIYGETKFVSFAALDKRLGERTLTFNGLSKTFAMTGWRLGWVAGEKSAIAAIRSLMSHQTTNPVSFAQAGALAAYTSPEAADTVEGMRKEFARRGKHMSERLNTIEGVECIEPTGAFYCFPDVSSHYGRAFGDVKVDDSRSFAAAALDQAKIAIIPGAAFGEKRCIRLSFATSMEQIDKGLDRLEELLK
ncbi:MAG: pyridoxal phosphate-dependent aminotransferase [Planctomycetota bacterium]|jgi:aspartate aminotransferase